MNEVTYTYRRTKEDFLAHSVWHRYFKNTWSLIINFGFPIMALLLLALSFTFEADIVFYIAIAYLITMPLIVYGLIRLRIKRMFDNPDFQFDETTFTFTEENFTSSSERGEVDLEYTYIHKAYVLEKYIYVYIDRVNAFLINKEYVGKGNSDKIVSFLEKKCPRGTVVIRTKK